MMAVTDADQPVEIGAIKSLPWVGCTEESYCQPNFRRQSDPSWLVFRG